MTMREVPTPQPAMRVLLLPLPQFALLPFGGFVDKLRFTADEEDYSRQRQCTWRVLGLAAGEVVASSGVGVGIQDTPDTVRWRDFDHLVIFGGRSAPATAALAPAYQALLRQALAAGLRLVAVDNASFLLAACGLLNGHKVAVHWRHEAEFRASYPQLEVVPGRLYSIDADRITCAGGTAAIDLAVELLARSCGRTQALKGLADMLVDGPRSAGHPLRSLDEAAISARPLARAIALMRTHLSAHLSVAALADMAGISRRQLDRLFRQHHACPAAAYWQEMRLQHARWRLLNSPHDLALIADEAGFADTSHLGRLFRKRFGHSPAAFRRQHRADNA
jgi:transcriptional regulator GlxA family with amidase domain